MTKLDIQYLRGYDDALTLIDEIAGFSKESIKHDFQIRKTPEEYQDFDQAKALLLPLLTMILGRKDLALLRIQLLNYLYVNANAPGGEHVANIAFAQFIAQGHEESAAKFPELFQSQAFKVHDTYVLKTISQNFTDYFIHGNQERIAKRLRLMKQAGVKMNARFIDVNQEEQSLATLLADYEVEDGLNMESQYRSAITLFYKFGVDLKLGRQVATQQQNEVYLDMLNSGVFD